MKLVGSPKRERRCGEERRIFVAGETMRQKCGGFLWRERRWDRSAADFLCNKCRDADREDSVQHFDIN